ncbi:hypothetical protein [uncultured Microbacterium sp.]|uniref:hypothetical protein n=1 Tax=uncultured Microbacterium sp. TaxID=191216 RepID=UPI0025DAFD21|nr:hypothetical protein [uncultured Microbacterium sp.]
MGASNRVIVLAMEQSEVIVVTPRSLARARGQAVAGVAMTASVQAAPEEVRFRLLAEAVPAAVGSPIVDAVRAVQTEIYVHTEAEADALPVGSIIRDNMHDARVKVTERAWEQSGERGKWTASWIAFPARVIYVPRDYDAALAAADATVVES